MKIVVGNVYCRLVPDDGDFAARQAAELPPHVLPPELHKEFRLFKPGSQFNRGKRSPKADYTEFISRTNGRFGIGLLDPVRRWLDQRNIFYTIQDLRVNLIPNVPVTADILPGITLRDYQIDALQAGVDKQNGLIAVPTGGGKTADLAAIPIVYQHAPDGRPYRHVYLLDRVTLARQTVERFLQYGLSTDDITLATGTGYERHTHDPRKYDEDSLRRARIVICMTQMASQVLKGLWQQFDAIEIDEAHHSRASGMRYQLSEATRARVRLGFSGTPVEGQWGYLHDDFQRMRYIGPIIYRIATDDLIKDGYLARPIIRFIEVCRRDFPMHAARDFREVYDTGIVHFDERNEIINTLARGTLGRTLILYKALEHGVEIMKRFGYHPDELREEKTKDGVRLIPIFHPKERWIRGEGRSHAKQIFQMDGQTEYGARDKLISAFMRSTHAVMTASAIFDEGLDLSGGINNLIVAGGEKSYIKQIQRLGRALRPNDVGLVHVWDFTDRSHTTLLEHSYLRAAIWDSEKHQIESIRFT